MRSQFGTLGAVPPFPIPTLSRAAYDIAFGLNICAPYGVIYDWFNTTFSVTFAIVEVTPGFFVECAIWDTLVYLDFTAFSLTGYFTCPDGCEFTNPPFNFP